MNILLDECTPRALKKRLPHLAIRTVQEMGWSGVKNGQLLKLVDQQFDVFITTDKNLRYQQNLARLKLAFLLLPTNRVRVVVALIPRSKKRSRQFNRATTLKSLCLKDSAAISVAFRHQ